MKRATMLLFVILGGLFSLRFTTIIDHDINQPSATAYNSNRHLDRHNNTCILRASYHDEITVPNWNITDYFPYSALSLDNGATWDKNMFLSLPQSPDDTIWAGKFPGVSTDTGDCAGFYYMAWDAIRDTIQKYKHILPVGKAVVGYIYIGPNITLGPAALPVSSEMGVGIPSADFYQIAATYNSQRDWYLWSACPLYSFKGYPEEPTVGSALAIRGFHIWWPENESYVRVALDDQKVYNYDYGDNAPGLAPRNVSMALSPHDASGPYLYRPHVVWEKDQKIWYIDFLEGSPRPLKLSQDGHDARNPSVAVYGDKVYVTWREGSPGEGEIVQRWRDLNDIYDVWEPDRELDPTNISNTPNQESDYPVIPTWGNDETWQEKLNTTNWDIFFLDDTNQETLNISNTPNSQSCYPHAAPALCTPPNSVNPYWFEYFMWTEGNGPSYDVMFARESLYYQPPHLLTKTSVSGKKDDLPPAFYRVECGAARVSPYCLKRAGHFRSGSHQVDYDVSELIYRLPWLEPHMHYYARIVVYGDTVLYKSPVALSERLEFDGKADTVIALSPGKPETLTYIIPKELYQDREVILRIRGTKGGPVVLEDLKVYQFEVIKDEPSIGRSSKVTLTNKPVATPVFEVTPNIFNKTTEIRFQHQEIGKPFSLKIFAISGEMVNDFTTALNRNPTEDRIRWDGTDDHGKRLSNGIYFIRFENGATRLTRKAMLIK